MSGPPPLPGVLATLAPVLDTYGYLAVGGLLFLEDFGVPAPGETVLVAAAVYAGAGRLDVGLVAVVAASWAFRELRRAGPEPRRRGRGFFTRHGGKIIVVAPSGQALWSAGVLLLVVVLVGPCRGRRVLVGVALVLALLVGGSLVVLGVHCPSDLLAGWSLALVADGLVLLLAARLAPSRVPVDRSADAD
ncbi:hypothetical protein GCM10023200_55990 [Actinomycetospora chlora]|uniref:Phosphatidic acid phosphatase type 2/haloperoxidase domain-containing protein n=1 Tax=Actinomycetospora chlora TaxID=663608 RepID=A0ABP9CGY2_9PSEU